MRRVRGVGDLTHYVELQTLTEPQDAGGNPDKQWKCNAKVWIAIDAITGDERSRGAQIEAGITTIVTAHYRDGVTPGMRFVQGTRILNIARAYDRDDDRKWLECQCKEVVAVSG